MAADPTKRWAVEDVEDYQDRNWSGRENRGYQMVYDLRMYDQKQHTHIIVRNVFSMKYQAVQLTPQIERQMLQDAEINAQKVVINYNLVLSAVLKKTLRVWRSLSRKRKAAPLRGNLPKKRTATVTQKVGSTRFILVDEKKKHWKDMKTGLVYSNGQYVRNIKKGKAARPLSS
jgi:hypothetical protein